MLVVGRNALANVGIFIHPLLYGIYVLDLGAGTWEICPAVAGIGMTDSSLWFIIGTVTAEEANRGPT